MVYWRRRFVKNFGWMLGGFLLSRGGGRKLRIGVGQGWGMGREFVVGKGSVRAGKGQGGGKIHGGGCGRKAGGVACPTEEGKHEKKKKRCPVGAMYIFNKMIGLGLW